MGQVLSFVDPDIGDLWVEGQVYNLNRGRTARRCVVHTTRSCSA